MRNVLFLTSSLMADGSKSSQLAAELVETVRTANPGVAVTRRDLTPATIPHLSLDTLSGLGTPADQRSAAQAEAVELADRLIEEVEAADTIVIAAPMYNFSIPSTLKAWLDHIARAGRTFRYTASGPEGLLTEKTVVVVASRGSVFTGDSPFRAMDHQEPYLRSFFGFLGITDVRFVHAEGQAVSAEAAAAGLAAARSEIGTVLAQAA